MIPLSNALKDKLIHGDLALGVSIMVPSPHAVEMVAQLGFDWVLIDCEHGAINLETVELMAMAATAWGCVPIGRPSSADPDAIARMMDRGVSGVQVPHVSNPEEAKTAVAAVKYHPLGRRSLAVGTRSARYGFGPSQDQYVRQSNADTLVCVQAEDISALKNLEQIAAVPGVDVVFLGPSDLSQSLGFPGQHTAPQVAHAMAEAMERLARCGVVSGTAGSVDALEQYRPLGVRYFYTHFTTLLRLGALAFSHSE